MHIKIAKISGEILSCCTPAICYHVTEAALTSEPQGKALKNHSFCRVSGTLHTTPRNTEFCANRMDPRTAAPSLQRDSQFRILLQDQVWPRGWVKATCCRTKCGHVGGLKPHAAGPSVATWVKPHAAGTVTGLSTPEL